MMNHWSTTIPQGATDKADWYTANYNIYGPVGYLTSGKGFNKKRVEFPCTVTKEGEVYAGARRWQHVAKNVFETSLNIGLPMLYLTGRTNAWTFLLSPLTYYVAGNLGMAGMNTFTSVKDGVMEGFDKTDFSSAFKSVVGAMKAIACAVAQGVTTGYSLYNPLDSRETLKKIEEVWHGEKETLGFYEVRELGIKGTFDALCKGKAISFAKSIFNAHLGNTKDRVNEIEKFEPVKG